MSAQQSTPGSPERKGIFPTTTDSVWELLRRSGETTEPDKADVAFGELCRRYAQPVQTYAKILCRNGRFSPEDAEDISQDFFLRLFHSQAFRESTRQAKFRSLLCHCFKNHFYQWIEKGSAQKRGGKVFINSLEAEIAKGESAAFACPPVAGEDWDILWAQHKFQLARERLRANYEADGKGALFDALVDQCAGGSGDSYAAIARILNKTVGSIKKDAERMRLRLQDCFNEEVALDFENPIEHKQEIQDEIAYLVGLLCRIRTT